MRMHFAVGMGRNERMDEIADHARVAEESGFEYVTFVDQPTMSRDVFVSMALAATNTHRIKIGQGVIDPSTHHPLVIAGATASVYELSGGRAFVGIGAGGPFGKAMRSMTVRELRDAVVLIKRFSAGEEVEVNGVKVQSEFSNAPLRVYVGCSGPNMFQMAGEVADGVMFSSNFGISPTMLKWKLEQVEKGALKAGRDPSKIDIWARAMMYVTNDPNEARREVASYAVNSAVRTILLLQRKGSAIEDLRQRLEREERGIIGECQKVYDAWEPKWHEHMDSPATKFVTQRLIDSQQLAGRPEDICEKIYKVSQLGIRTVATVTYTIADKKGMIRAIGDEIMPHFRN